MATIYVNADGVTSLVSKTITTASEYIQAFADVLVGAGFSEATVQDAICELAWEYDDCATIGDDKEETITAEDFD